jgi:hypothetical protein
MLNFFKTKTFKVASFVIAFAVMFTLTASAYTFSGPTLKKGMKGGEVAELQTLVGAIADGNFGPATHAKVATWQAANGLTVDGVFGKMSMMKANGGSVSTGGTVALCPNGMTLASNCAMAPGGTTGGTTGGTLTGGAGSITVDDSSEFSSEEVGEGEKDVEVLEFSVEADDESDVKVTSVKVEFVESGTTSSEDLDDYVDSVSIWFDGKKVGEADANDFSESSDVWTKSITLDNAVVKKGAEMEFVVAVTSLTNLDSGDIDSDAWTVDVLNVRFMDAEGVSTTEDTDGDLLEKTFDFASFATAADVELKVSLGDKDINDSRSINVDDTDTTDDVSLLAFELEAEGSDITVDALPVLVTTTETTGTDPADLISTLYLYADGKKIGTESMNDAGDDSADTVVFDDLDYEIKENSTVKFVVKAKLKSTGSTLDNGDTIQVTFGETQTDLATFEAKDEQGEDILDADVTGTAAGDAHGVYDVGISAKLVSASAKAIPSGVADVDDQGMFTITFDVTAFDSDIYVDGTAITDEAGGATYQNISADNIVATGVIDCSACDDGANSTFKVAEGTTERFVVTISGPAAADVFAKASLESILYATTAIDGDTLYTFNMDEFQTENVFLNDNA